ncbi:hypothetical protein U9M48_027698, partial [Paspalum notatum var. saurae]
MRWFWLEKTEDDKPWASLPIQVPKVVWSFFSMAIYNEVGNGGHTLFWTDKWLHGQCIANLAPQLFRLVSKRKASRRTILQALTQNAWISDLQGALGVAALIEYLQLWGTLSQIVLDPEAADRHIWHFSPSGQYSTKSSYESFFQGLLHKVGLQSLCPKLVVASFGDWWRHTNEAVPGPTRQGLNSKHRNICVLDGVSPNLAGLVNQVLEELDLWSLAGASLSPSCPGSGVGFL